MNFSILPLNPQTIHKYGVCGYKDVSKHIELKKKLDWFATYYPKGLRINIALVDDTLYQGMIEYIPGSLAHRPVEAEEYMFIHCIFSGFRKEYKGKGIGTALIQSCITESRELGFKGVAVLTRKGSFMANKSVFIKNDFVVCDTAPPDFELLALRFDNNTPLPIIKKNINSEYNDGLTIIRSPQCPYTEKNVNAIIKTANKMKLKTNLVELTSVADIQKSPCPFGTFAILHDGKVISHHPISNTRFENIMLKRGNARNYNEITPSSDAKGGL